MNINRIIKNITVIKSVCRSCSTNVNRHVYDNVIPFETNKQLANHLCNNILYDKNGLIVVNKPYGICFSRDRPQWKAEKENAKVIKHKLDYAFNPISAELDNVNLFEALPFMKLNLNCNSLCVIRSPEKYTTGVCILGRNENVRSIVNKCWERSKAQKIPIESYLAICTGIPISNYLDDFRIGITLDVAENGKTKKAILTKHYSKISVLESRVKVATVRSSLLSVNAAKLASLIEITCNQKKWHFLRLFLASHLMSPALGDHLYGSRVKNVMGTYVAINHWSEHASLPQTLPSELLKLLDLNPGSEKYIPAMIHLSQVNLIGYPNRSKNLILSAPSPSHFDWTMDKLGLQMPRTLALEENSRQDKMLL